MWIMKTMVSLLTLQMLMYKNHMLMLIIIITSCLVMSLKMFSLSMNHWMTMMIILIYISGIMVLFMFIVSLAPNEKNLLKKNKLTFLFILSMLIMTSLKMNFLQEQKMNSFYKTSFIMMIIMIMVITLSTYIPPKILLLMHKGMKSSK